jgi:4'-phosphopantetheinyl transferase
MIRPYSKNAVTEIAPREIHLWLAFYDELRDHSLLSAYRALLTDDERKAQGRFYFPRDRLRYLLTRALVRTTLSFYAPISPKQWAFSTNPFGRPTISNPHPLAAQLSFNISHTHSMVALGVTCGRALGVDVENACAREPSMEIADRFFAPDEARSLAALPRNQRQTRFLEYWTFKESYIKARGMGLSIPLDKFSFRYPHDRGVAIEIDPDLKDYATRWQFWQFRPRTEYLLAVCAERVDMRPSRIVINKIMPLVDKELMDLSVLRMSE